MAMVVAEVYFAYLAVLALSSRAASRRRLAALAAAIGALAAVVLFGMANVLPLVYLLAGYWIPGLLAAAPNIRLEKKLLSFDRRLFGETGLRSFALGAPVFVLHYLELAYLLCYAVVPAGFVWLVSAGLADEAEGFWSVVLLASFSCYGLLPWMPTRAPRALESDSVRGRSGIRRLNLVVLDRASVQWNTFPSGHTAASIATALAVGIHLPVAGAVLSIVAVSIAAGSVTGRYHYAADALAGAAVALAAFLTASGVLAR